jgi:lysophospholipid acyltransferase (LPLAT)-like uncharacterized protein
MKRVDNIPFYLQPLFLLFGYSLGVLLFLYTKLVYRTHSIKFTGAAIPQNQPVVYCIWHQDLVLYFSVFNNVKKQVWMNHPAWYMKPIHVLLYLTGVEKICLGSSGNSGKQALENVIGFLKQGYSTTVACDGPAGPPLMMKPGVLLMSRDAQIPVVPLRFSSAKSYRLGGWDKKVMPFLFSPITVYIGEPVQVTEQNFKEAQKRLEEFLATV